MLLSLSLLLLGHFIKRAGPVRCAPPPSIFRFAPCLLSATAHRALLSPPPKCLRPCQSTLLALTHPQGPPLRALRRDSPPGAPLGLDAQPAPLPRCLRGNPAGACAPRGSQVAHDAARPRGNSSRPRPLRRRRPRGCQREARGLQRDGGVVPLGAALCVCDDAKRRRGLERGRLGHRRQGAAAEVGAAARGGSRRWGHSASRSVGAA